MQSTIKRCPVCGQPAGLSAAQCLRCGHLYRTVFPAAPVVLPVSYPHPAFTPFPARDVSHTFTAFFGCFYFIVKGWWKAAIAAFLLCLLTSGLAWIPIACFAPSFVDSLEGKAP